MTLPGVRIRSFHNYADLLSAEFLGGLNQLTPP